MSSRRGFGNSYEQNSEGGRPGKFLYTGKNKKVNPWSSNGLELEDGMEFAVQPQNSPFKNKDNRSSPGFELNDVWSIRKNVQVTQANKKGIALSTNTSTASYYSRHGGLGTGNLESSLLSKGQNDDFCGSSVDHKSWSVTRGSYSYSDKPKFSGNDVSLDQPPNDILESSTSSNRESIEMVAKKNLINSKFRMAGAPQMTTREMSARTQRAKKMHDAHLRSMGMGQCTPLNSSSYIDEQGKGSWRGKDEDFI